MWPLFDQRNIRPDVVTSIYPTNMLGMRYYVKKYGIDVPSYQYVFANPVEVWLVKLSGKKLIVWTVNSKPMIKWLKMLHVDGIMTDDPNLFKP